VSWKNVGEKQKNVGVFWKEVQRFWGNLQRNFLVVGTFFSDAWGGEIVEVMAMRWVKCIKS